jgi:hypothetical protein
MKFHEQPRRPPAKQGAAAPTKKNKNAQYYHIRNRKSQQSDRNHKQNTCMATAGYQHKKELTAFAIEKQNNSFFKHITCTLDDGQLGRNMQCELD